MVHWVHRPLLAASVAALLIACSGGAGSSYVPDADRGSSSSGSASGASSSSSGSSSSNSSSSSSSSGGSPSFDGPLQLTSLDATVRMLTLYPTPPTETIKTQLVAIVTHSGGNERIAGGRLEDEQGNVYGAFGTGANKSTFVLDIDWMQINAVSPVRVKKGGGRTFAATFFDNDGHRVTRTLELTFQCRVLSGALGFTPAQPFPSGGVLTGIYDGKCWDDTRCGVGGEPCGSGTSCNGETGACEPIDFDQVGCLDRERFLWLRSSECSCASSSCGNGECACNP